MSAEGSSRGGPDQQHGPSRRNLLLGVGAAVILAGVSAGGGIELTRGEPKRSIPHPVIPKHLPSSSSSPTETELPTGGQLL